MRFAQAAVSLLVGVVVLLLATGSISPQAEEVFRGVGVVLGVGCIVGAMTLFMAALIRRA